LISQSTQLLQLIRPNPPHKPIIYAALCNSLAKAILLQAETEVTAEKRAAIPLARVTFNLLTALEMFPEFLWPKLVQRVGGWPVPAIIPETDIDGRRWGAGPKGKGRGGERERHRVMGYRPGSTSDNALESPSEYSVRVAGIMRVYWEIVKVQLRFPERAPPLGPFAMPKVWVWFARILDSKALMDTAVCAELIYSKHLFIYMLFGHHVQPVVFAAALEVIGTEAADIWGVQWIKILQLIYEGTSTGVFGQAGKLLGGDSPEGKAAKARIQMEIERIVSGRAK
jgi:nucleoporin GLE1